ncbi:MAG: 1-deoxy-D-xylulose-5-phosphate reductoisomerase [Acidaminococcaceae bacterium]|nr:1-deoxy-D-xylulose-5-phosphate reductoisomerase [Acidaminococcaceae bacterium]
MKRIVVLGSTGSIGRQTLEVVLANPDKLKIVGLVAHKNDALLEQQIALCHPEVAVLTEGAAGKSLQKRYTGGTKILCGEEGLMEAATWPGADTVVGAMVGYAGLRPTLAAIAAGKNIALANKETLVAAGQIVMDAVAYYNVSLTPVDSEHSAIFQALRGGAKGEVKNLIITASGGPFRGKTRAELEQVTLEQCLKHPNWSMGPKVTIDSSTLANKGLEVMEAHWLFDMPYDKIKVLVHPESIVHSLVEFVDGSVLAQLGNPDMRLPIQYALSWPERFDYAFETLDLVQRHQLTFEAPDLESFPALQLARECGMAGGILPCVFNAANEEAVNLFIQGRISYLDIYRITEKMVGKFGNSECTLENIEAADGATRLVVKREWA